MRKRSIQKIMRQLHRDIGFLVIGLTLLFAFSGIVLVYRNTDMFTYEKKENAVYDKQLNHKDLARALPFRNVQPMETKGDTTYFAQGYYLASSGEAFYSYQSYPWIIRKFNFLHKSRSDESTHWIATIYGILLLFLAISSFWMFKPGSHQLKRGLIIAGVGIVGVVLLLLLI